MINFSKPCELSRQLVSLGREEEDEEKEDDEDKDEKKMLVIYSGQSN